MHRMWSISMRNIKIVWMQYIDLYHNFFLSWNQDILKWWQVRQHIMYKILHAMAFPLLMMHLQLTCSLASPKLCDFISLLDSSCQPKWMETTGKIGLGIDLGSKHCSVACKDDQIQVINLSNILSIMKKKIWLPGI